MSTPLPPAGWYPDPYEASGQRWWDGARWTEVATPAPATASATVPPTTTTTATTPRSTPEAWRPTLSTWIVGAIAVLCGVIALPAGGVGAFILTVALFAMGGAIYTLATGRRGWLNLPGTRKASGGALGLAVVALLLGSLLAPHPASAPAAAPLGVASELGSGAVSSPTKTPTTPTKTPTPTPTPVVTVQSVDVPESVPFASSSYEEPTIEAGTSVVVTAGVAGTKVSTWKVTLVDGVESGRVLVSEKVTVEPIDEVTAIGVGEAPAPDPEPAAADPAPEAATEPAPDSGGCDPNYSGPCVPTASDVDCAGGSGDGPAYVQGPVYVVGSDPYDLDRDGDGVGCD